MPPVKKAKKQPQTADPPAENASVEPEEQLAISGQLDKKIKNARARRNRQRGVVVIRHLPHGFFEEQLKNYFEQFGKVTRLRLARSTRTGGSKGFAFVEFEYPEVAEVAAQTMDNYLMFQKVVKAQFIPPEAQKYNYFKSSVRKVLNKVGKPIYVSGKTASIQKKAIEYNNWSDEAYQKRIGSNLRKLEKLKEKYAHLGIDFDNFTVKPNIQSVDEKEEKAKNKKAEAKASSQNKQKPEAGSILLLKKGKQPEEGTKKSKNPKAKKIIELKDLLENTLNEEASSEDEEFVPTEDVTTSDEEDYGLLDDDDDEEEEKIPVPKKAVKPVKVDRAAELLKRKPNAGGIQKNKILKDKNSKKPSSVAKKSLKVEAMKDIKELGKTKQMKKTDFNKKSIKKKRV